MSLDLIVNTPDCPHCKREGERIAALNLTHNLAKMAGEVWLDEYRGLTLYGALWRGDEHGIATVAQLAAAVENGKNIMQERPSLRKYNPENGWGSYEGFIDALERFLHELEQRRDQWDGAQIRWDP